MTGIEEIRTEFSDTVREAVGIRIRAGSYGTGPDTLVLELPCNQGTRYAVFTRTDSAQQLSKLVFIQQDGKFSPEHFITYRPNLHKVRFEYDAADVVQARRVLLYLEIDKGVEPKTPSLGHTFYAAVRAVNAGEHRP
jgi:hypothetical protein